MVHKVVSTSLVSFRPLPRCVGRFPSLGPVTAAAATTGAQSKFIQNVSFLSTREKRKTLATTRMRFATTQNTAIVFTSTLLCKTRQTLEFTAITPTEWLLRRRQLSTALWDGTDHHATSSSSSENDKYQLSKKKRGRKSRQLLTALWDGTDHHTSSSSSSANDNYQLSKNKRGRKSNNKKNKISIKENVHHILFTTILPQIIEAEYGLKENTNNCDDHSDDSFYHRNDPNNNKVCVVDVTLLVGVSGGCDSIALLRILQQIILTMQQEQRSSLLRNTRTTDDDDRQQQYYHYGDMNLHVVHFDHQQRGVESDMDRQFVQNICQNEFNNIPFHCYKFDDDNQHGSSTSGKKYDDHYVDDSTEGGLHTLRSEAGTRQKQPFTQDIGRKWRRRTMSHLLRQIILTTANDSNSIDDNADDYCSANGTRNKIKPFQHEKLQQQQKQRKHIGLLVTAHHQDDSDETMLLKMLRGVHITNLNGLLPFTKDNSRDDCDHDDDYANGSILQTTPVSASIGHNSMTITPNKNMSTTTTSTPEIALYWVRPFIETTKKDIQEYLLQNKYTWREDASNQSNKYLRNRVRNELIPLLQDLLLHQQQNENKKELDSVSCPNQQSLLSPSFASSLLHRKLRTMEQQSIEIQNDLNDRADQYIVESGSTTTYFILPNTSQRSTPNVCSASNISSALLKHALHRWIVQQQPQPLLVQPSYETLQRVIDLVDQDSNHHRRHRRLQKKWRINIGRGYDIERCGDALQLVRSSSSVASTTSLSYGTGVAGLLTDESASSNFRDVRGVVKGQVLKWAFLQPSYDAKDTMINSVQAVGGASVTTTNRPHSDTNTADRGCIHIKVPTNLVTTRRYENEDAERVNGTCSDGTNYDIQVFLPGLTEFVCTRVQYLHHQNQLFYPPWRNNPMNVYDFLRGQKVPLHLRKEAPVIVLHQLHQQKSKRNDDDNINNNHNNANRLMNENNSTSTTSMIVAVYVCTKQKWFIDLKFFWENSTNNSTSPTDNSAVIKDVISPTIGSTSNHHHDDQHHKDIIIHLQLPNFELR